MRLVDANELKHEIVGTIPMMATVRIPIKHKIDAAPTVNAIPVEWLKNRREGMIFAAMTNSQVYGNNTIELCHAVNVVLDMWREEQEAR